MKQFTKFWEAHASGLIILVLITLYLINKITGEQLAVASSMLVTYGFVRVKQIQKKTATK